MADLEFADKEGLEKIGTVLPWLAGIQAGILLFVLGLAVVYVGGPPLIDWTERGVGPVSHWIALRIPWRWKRMQRVFSSMLAVLLDAGVPEDRSLRLAGETTANHFFKKRVAQAIHQIEQGAPLTEAVAELDPAGEFRWRLTNALHSKGSLSAALEGWHQALEARSFQLEQATAQILTTLFLGVNAILVGTVAAGGFLFLRTIILEGTLW